MSSTDDFFYLTVKDVVDAVLVLPGDLAVGLLLPPGHGVLVVRVAKDLAHGGQAMAQARQGVVRNRA